MDVFAEMGISDFGILLSEKDSIVYQQRAGAGAALTDRSRSRAPVPDYTGANKEERDQRIAQIINIARDNGYNSIFAGYGFMAEDETMVALPWKRCRLNFIGPCSRTVHDAGPEGRGEAHRPARPGCR